MKKIVPLILLLSVTLSSTQLTYWCNPCTDKKDPFCIHIHGGPFNQHSYTSTECHLPEEFDAMTYTFRCNDQCQGGCQIQEYFAMPAMNKFWKFSYCSTTNRGKTLIERFNKYSKQDYDWCKCPKKPATPLEALEAIVAPKLFAITLKLTELINPLSDRSFSVDKTCDSGCAIKVVQEGKVIRNECADDYFAFVSTYEKIGSSIAGMAFDLGRPSFCIPKVSDAGMQLINQLP